MNLVTFLTPALIAAIFSFGLTPLVRRLAERVGAIDRPGPRKVHRSPTPRLGGVAIVVASVAGFAAFLLLLPQGALRTGRLLTVGVACGIVPILFVSLWDDVRGLGAWPKLAGHVAGAAIAVACGVCLNPSIHVFGRSVDIGMFAVPLSMLWMVGLTNAFNIVDGLDGLSAGLALIGSGSLAAVFLVAELPAMAAASLVVAGALVGFLPYNVYPARIFLGDTGATAIGFVLACFALRGGTTIPAGFAALLPVFIVGLPVAETVVSMLRRFLHRATTGSGNGVMEPDRNHFHHRLLELGIDHRRAVLILYGVGLVLAGCALLSILMTAFEAGLLLTGLSLAGLVSIGRLHYDEFAFIRNGSVLRFYDAPVLRRSVFAVFADLALVELAIYVSIVLKFEDLTLARYQDTAAGMFAVMIPMTVACFWALGLYRDSWRVAGVRDFYRLCLAVAVSSFLGFLAYQLLWQHTGSLSLFGIYMLVKTALANGARVSYRVLLDKQRRALNHGAPALIYGAGFGGADALRQLLSNLALGLRPVGFIDDDPTLAGKSVNGYPVVGDVDGLPSAIARLKPRALIVSSQKIPASRIRQASQACAGFGVRVVRMNIRFDSCPEVYSGQEGKRGAVSPALAAREVTVA